MTTDLSRLRQSRYPRSAGYDPQWLVDNWMGPQPLWLLEWLAPALDLKPGMRVLDLGCGRALTSIFLAREYGVQVVAADLWVKPGENWPRILQAGCAEQVLPILAEAHDLPFAEGSFDAVVSIDAYHYFGTNELYLPYLSRFVAPGGRIGMVVPGLAAELTEVPDHLREFWQPEFWSFHSAGWWRTLWERSGAVRVEVADRLEDGWRDWLLWCEVCAEHSTRDLVLGMIADELPMVRRDAGRDLGFVRAVGVVSI
jgi:cyclopropane fatty-acyl-phospholipid synthase-like methyltransferase